MKISELMKPEFVDMLMEENLFDSYETVIMSIKENKSDEQYTPIYSYEKDEEDERLNELKLHFETIIEWYVGADWRSKYEDFLRSNSIDRIKVILRQ